MTATPFGLDRASLDALAGALLQFLVQGALVAAVLAVTFRVLSRASAQARYVAGCAALLLMLAAPIATFFALRATAPAMEPAAITQSEPRAPGSTPLTLAAPQPSVASSAAGVASPVAGAVSAAAVSDELVPSSRLDSGDPHPRLSAFALIAVVTSSWRAATSPWRPDLAARLTPWLVAAWGIGVALLTLRLIGGWWLVRRLGRASHQALDRWREPMARLARRMGVSRAVRLCQSDRVDVPTTLGWLKPMVLLPASAVTGLGAAQIEAILAHELAHIRRHDYLVNLLQSVVETLLFYHPAVWWVSRRIREERELCCDDLAVRACGDAATYARALCELEALRAPQSAPYLALAATGGSLVARIARLIGRPTLSHPRDVRGGIAATLLAAGAVVTLAAAGLGVAPRGTANASASLTHPDAVVAEADVVAPPAPAQPGVDAGPCPDAASAEGSENTPEAPPETGWSFEPLVASFENFGDLKDLENLADLAVPLATLTALATPATPAVAATPTPQSPQTPEIACDEKSKPAPEDESDDAETPIPPRAPLAPMPPRLVEIVMPQARVVAPRSARAQARMSRQISRSMAADAESDAQSLAKLYERKHGLSSRATQLSGEDLDRLEQMGITRDYIQRVSRQLAEPPSGDDVRRLFNNGVTPEYLGKMRRLGLDRLTPEEATRLVSNGVTPEYVSGLRGMDPNELGADNLIRLASHGVSAEWFSAMRWLGYRDLTVDDAVRLANHGLTPDRVGQLNAVARRPFAVEELIQLASNGVDPDYVARLRGRVREDLGARDLVRLRQNGVDPKEVSALEALGYARLTPQELVSLQQNGIGAAFVAEMLGAGLDRPTVRELVQMRQSGMTAEFVQEARAAGWDGLSLEELISMRRTGVHRYSRP